MTVSLSDTPVLETERLRLRAPVAADWPAWRDMALSARARFITMPEIDELGAWRGIGHIIGHWVLRGWGSFIITRKGDDAAIGMTGPWFPATWPEHEIGWAVWDAAAEGKGIAFEAAQAARTHAYDVLGWTTAVSFIDPENARSIRLAERLGAVREPGAPTPGGRDLLCYRHPAPEAAA